jgi:hypothetical protein
MFADLFSKLSSLIGCDEGCYRQLTLNFRIARQPPTIRSGVW